MSQVLHVTSETFEQEVLSSDVPVLIDFYATWCGPCKMMAPVVDRAAKQAGTTAKVVKIDVDEAPEIASAFRVSSIPTFVVVHQGKAVAASVGMASQDKLLAMLQKAAPVGAAR